MRILFIRPHPELRVARALQSGFLNLEPLNLEIVAGGVPPEHDVRILDLSVERAPQSAFIQTLDSFQPALVGFTAYSSTFHVVNRLAAEVKERLPSTWVMVGGIHATLRPLDYAQGAIDIIVRGEGGSKMASIMADLQSGAPPAQRDGILYTRTADWRHRATDPIPPFPPLDRVPAPRRDLVDRNKYFCIWTSPDKQRPKTIFPRVASLRTSVGCPFRCSFCVVHHLMHGRHLRRTAEDVVDELSALEEDFVYFVDDEMFVNPQIAMEIANLLLQRGIRKHYISWARSDTIVRHPEVFTLWRHAGLDVLYVGLESMDQDALDGFSKKTTAGQNQRAADILREIGIGLHAAFMVNPDFDREHFLRLEQAVVQFSPAEFSFTVLSPSPGTALWEAHRDRFICDPFRNYDCMHTLLPTHLPLQRFYQHFGRLYALAFRRNPLRLNRVCVTGRDRLKAIVRGTKYVAALYMIYRDYPEHMWQRSGKDLLTQANGRPHDEHR